MDPLASFRDEVESSVKAALDELGAKQELQMEVPDAAIADFAFPCFSLAKVLRKAPAAIAEELASKVKISPMLERVWADKGYLNFKVNHAELIRITLQEVIRTRSDYGKGDDKGTKVLLEHTSVNPTGPIHVGRARNPIIGDTLARCLRKCGYQVTTEYLVNDVGRQVVLLSWGVRNIPSKGVIPASDRQKDDHLLVGFYQKANERLESEPEVESQIASLTRGFEAGDPEVISMVRETTERMLQGIKESLSSINVELDNYTWESQFIINGEAKRVVERLKSTPECHEEDGAFYLDLSAFGIHGRDTKFFFTRADGTTLYTTRDMAYHLDKFKRADQLINILGEDQKLGQQQLAAALRILGENKAPECMYYAFVSLPEGRMSTRKGLVVCLDDLIDEAEDRAYEEVKKRRTDLSEEKMRQIARDIGRGALRFNIVRVQAEKQIVFKWEEALNFEGNSAPFVQYSHARCCSILGKAGEFERVVEPSLLNDPYERKLIRILAQYPTVVRDCGLKRRIHLMPAYGQEVASAFNQFYAYVPVLRSGERQAARLTLVESTMWVLRGVLGNLGIVAPEEM
jgi:arginyl-tRNA synthetase